MPIRPENRHRYPADWPDISKRIRFDRAGGWCECTGQCGYTDHRTGPDGNRCPAQHGQPHPISGSRVVLTVAHLDQQPENSDETNLLALCQRCHLAYDADQHATTRRRTRETAHG